MPLELNGLTLTEAEQALEALVMAAKESAQLEVELEFAPIATEMYRNDHPFPAHTIEGTEQTADSGKAELLVNGKPATEADVMEINAQIRSVVLRRAERKLELEREQASEVLAGLGLELPSGYAGGRTQVILPREEVARLLGRDRSKSKLREIRPAQFNDRADPAMSSALQHIGVSTVAFPNNDEGTDIGIWWNDGPDSDFTFNSPGPGCPLGNYTRQDPGETVTSHATRTFCILRTTAPEAHIHIAEPTQSCNLRNDVHLFGFGTPKVYISSISDSYNDPMDRDYDSCERDWDNFVVDTRIAHFAATGNEADTGDGYVRGAAQAYNVISIGNYDETVNPPVVYFESNWKDPDTGALKPELVAPGVINIPTWGDPYGTGTSYSTPMAAGFAADLMEGRAHLQYRPQLLKAQLIANATSVQADTNKDGWGRVDYGKAEYNGWLGWFEGTHAAVFNTDADSDGRPDRLFTKTLIGGRTYQVVISWLVDGDDVLANNEPNLKVRLKVTAPDGQTSWVANDGQQTHQRVAFQAPMPGTYYFSLERQSTSTIPDDVALAYYINW